MSEAYHNHSIDMDLQVRLMNLVMGEASDFERDQLQLLMEQRPELIAYLEHMEHLHGLLCEVGSGELTGMEHSATDGDWQLSLDRRGKLLAVLDEGQEDASEKVSLASKQGWRWRRLTKIEALVAASIACVVIGLLWPASYASRKSARELSSSYYLSDDVVHFPAPARPIGPAASNAEPTPSDFAPNVYFGAPGNDKGKIDAIAVPSRRQGGVAAEGKVAAPKFYRTPAKPSAGGPSEPSSLGDIGARFGAQESFKRLEMAPDVTKAPIVTSGPPPVGLAQAGGAPAAPGGGPEMGGGSFPGGGGMGAILGKGSGINPAAPAGPMAGTGGMGGMGGGGFGGGSGGAANDADGVTTLRAKGIRETTRYKGDRLQERMLSNASSGGEGKPATDSKKDSDPFDDSESAESGVAGRWDFGKRTIDDRAPDFQVRNSFGVIPPAGRPVDPIKLQRGSNLFNSGNQQFLNDLSGQVEDFENTLMMTATPKIAIPGEESEDVIVGSVILNGAMIPQLRAKQNAPAFTADAGLGGVGLGGRLSEQIISDELSALSQAFSTFSLHVSDVSFKLAQTALAQGQMPDRSKLRIEEFVNALDYGDPLPTAGQKIACRVEQAIHPSLMQRNLLRVSMRTAATGRSQNTPLRLTCLLDNSGSMERPDRRQAVLKAFQSLTQQLNAGDQITLISFASTPRLLAEKMLGNQGPALLSLMENLPSEGGTNIEAAMLLGFEKAVEQQLPGAQNRIVMLTDGAVNLGNANPESLAKIVTRMRDAGIAFDAAGISAQDLNDDVLERLTRQGDGRYYLLGSAESVDDSFASQIAGALRPSAQNVKVQVEFNPQRVGRYKLLGFEKHLLNEEDFRNDQVDAAELAAAEAGVAVYQIEVKPNGSGDVGSVSVRFRDLSTGQMIENRWPILYEPCPPRIDQAQPSMQMAAAATLFAIKLGGGPLGDGIDLSTLQSLLANLPSQFATQPRVEQLRQMIAQAKSLGL